MTDTAINFVASGIVYWILIHLGAYFLNRMKRDKAEYDEYIRGKSAVDPRIMIGELAQLEHRITRVAKSHIKLRQKVQEHLQRPVSMTVVMENGKRRKEVNV